MKQELWEMSIFLAKNVQIGVDTLATLKELLFVSKKLKNFSFTSFWIPVII